MASRLPTPGGDQGSWGDILNDFLNQSHTSTGTLKDASVGASQLQDGAVTRAKTSSAVQTSLDAADNAIPASQKGASGGVASLTGTTLTPAQIPTTVVTKSADSNDTGKAIDAHTGAPLAVVSTTDVEAAGAEGSILKSGPGGSLDSATDLELADLFVDNLPGIIAEYGARPIQPVFERPAATIVENFQSGHGWTVTAASQAADTSDYVFGTQCQRITTASGASANVTETGLTAVNGENRTFRAWVKFDDWTKVNRLVLIASDDPTFANFYAITNYLVPNDVESRSPWKDGEWQCIEFSWTKAAETGTVDRTDITALRLLVGAESGQTVTLRINRVDHVAKVGPYANGVVSLTFDDTVVSAFTRALPKMSTYGYRGTLFPITERFDADAAYLTTEQAKQLYHLHGWEIAAHTDTYANHTLSLTGMTQEQRLAMFNAIRNWQQENGFNSPTYAYANGNWDHASAEDVQQFFSQARLAAAYYGQQQVPQHPLAIQSVNAGAPSLATIQGYIDQAYAEGSWLVLMFHDIVASGATGNDIDQADFDDIIEYLDSTGIAVATMQEVLRASAA